MHRPGRGCFDKIGGGAYQLETTATTRNEMIPSIYRASDTVERKFRTHVLKEKDFHTIVFRQEVRKLIPS